jgi:hypothetical protein
MASLERYAPRLLLWIWGETGGELELPVSCAGFGSAQSIPMSVVRSIADRLSAQALVRTHDSGGAPSAPPEVSLLAAGAAQVRRLQTQRADPAERGRHARRAVLQWIYAQADRQPLRISGFLDSSEVFFLGDALTRGEVARSLSYLTDSGLITCGGPPFHNDVGSYVALTPDGVEAVLSGSDIGTYVERLRERAQPAQHTRIEAGTVQYAQGDFRNDVRSDITVHSALAPADLARLIAELAPALTLDPASRAALLRTAQSLEPDAGGDGPGTDRQRGLLERIRHQLGAAPDTVGRQVLLDAVGQSLGRLLGG